jgi:hypothetical protein
VMAIVMVMEMVIMKTVKVMRDGYGCRLCWWWQWRWCDNGNDEDSDGDGDYSPNISISKSISLVPALFVAMQVYLALSVTFARVISICFPPFNTRMCVFPDDDSGIPFLNHVISGGGVPDAGHWRMMERFTMSWGDLSR